MVLMTDCWIFIWFWWRIFSPNSEWSPYWLLFLLLLFLCFWDFIAIISMSFHPRYWLYSAHSPTKQHIRDYAILISSNLNLMRCSYRDIRPQSIFSRLFPQKVNCCSSVNYLSHIQQSHQSPIFNNLKWKTFPTSFLRIIIHIDWGGNSHDIDKDDDGSQLKWYQYQSIMVMGAILQQKEQDKQFSVSLPHNYMCINSLSIQIHDCEVLFVVVMLLFPSNHFFCCCWNVKLAPKHPE